jgi:transposase-like protein
MPPTKPPYPPEFRREAVQLTRTSERSIAQVARDLGVSNQTLRNWIKQADVDTGKRGNTRLARHPVGVAEGATAVFSATATDAAGNTSACSAPISYMRVKAPAPSCVVPKLAGKTPARAKSALKAAGCSVGKVTKPKARKGKKLGRLVVIASKPSMGRTLPAGSKVGLRLGPKYLPAIPEV